MIGFDTNVLVYAADRDEPAKRAVALRLVGRAIEDGTAFMPLQVLAEFYHVATRRVAIGGLAARRLVEDWRAAVAAEGFSGADLAAAMAAHERHRLAVWDALIWATCDRVGATVLATEDLQDGRTLGRVTFLDPFNPANAPRLGLA